MMSLLNNNNNNMNSILLKQNLNSASHELNSYERKQSKNLVSAAKKPMKSSNTLFQAVKKKNFKNQTANNYNKSKDFAKQNFKLDRFKRLIIQKIEKPKTGIIILQSTMNNTIITLTDLAGNTLFCISAGNLGFKNTRKSSHYAASSVAEKIALNAYNAGYQYIILKLKGLGLGRTHALRAFKKSHLKFIQIQDITPLPFNGCRPSRKRRI
uniref:Ribosomal protein S11 n=1 Tax=Helicosporidium sp. subsp. Simulium jonesii TaxID=145475 RepID=D3IZY5_HELSJ|nr:ribosomal protein S11 [Helicosporidium sp. ex Simulium jonesi]ACT36212.1 ribosomal protein S11 [Helicosporidium sp. ex Simulium jonesi]